MKLIPLTHGKFAKVDDDDYERLMQWKWRWSPNGYAIRTGGKGRKNRTWIGMHNEVLSVPEGTLPDHKDGDGLNNQKDNLRPATNSQNQANAKISSRNKSGYKGVSWHSEGKCWVAKIRADDKQHHLGLFLDPKDAALAYDEAARRLFGEFARTNFPA